jgi:hypothetical protein
VERKLKTFLQYKLHLCIDGKKGKSPNLLFAKENSNKEKFQFSKKTKIEDVMNTRFKIWMKPIYIIIIKVTIGLVFS